MARPFSRRPPPAPAPGGPRPTAPAPVRLPGPCAVGCRDRRGPAVRPAPPAPASRRRPGRACRATEARTARHRPSAVPGGSSRGCQPVARPADVLGVDEHLRQVHQVVDRTGERDEPAAAHPGHEVVVGGAVPGLPQDPLGPAVQGSAGQQRPGGGVGAALPDDHVGREVGRGPALAQRRCVGTDVGERVGEGRALDGRRARSRGDRDGGTRRDTVARHPQLVARRAAVRSRPTARPAGPGARSAAPGPRPRPARSPAGPAAGGWARSPAGPSRRAAVRRAG